MIKQVMMNVFFFFKVTCPEPFGGAFWEILFRLSSLKQGGPGILQGFLGASK